MVAERLRDRKQKLRTLMMEMDRRSTGSISAANFRSALATLKVEITADDASGIFQMLAKADGPVAQLDTNVVYRTLARRVTELGQAKKMHKRGDVEGLLSSSAALASAGMLATPMPLTSASYGGGVVPSGESLRLSQMRDELAAQEKQINSAFDGRERRLHSREAEIQKHVEIMSAMSTGATFSDVGSMLGPLSSTAPAALLGAAGNKVSLDRTIFASSDDDNKHVRKRKRKKIEGENLMKVHAKMMAASYAVGGSDFGKLFSRIDKDGSGTLELDEVNVQGLCMDMCMDVCVDMRIAFRVATRTASML